MKIIKKKKERVSWPKISSKLHFSLILLARKLFIYTIYGYQFSSVYNNRLTSWFPKEFYRCLRPLSCSCLSIHENVMCWLKVTITNMLCLCRPTDSLFCWKTQPGRSIKSRKSLYLCFVICILQNKKIFGHKVSVRTIFS